MASFVAPVSTSEPRKQLPAGMYTARCYQMIQLGTHEEEFQGQKKIVPKIWLGWEFPTKLDKFGDDDELKPYTMGKEYSFYMNDKANFRKDLESWRGVKFTDDQANTFDAIRVLGAPCTINVMAYTKRNGEEGVKIGSISPLMDGVTCPAAIFPKQPLSLSREEFDKAVFDNLPKFLKEKIEKSPEYKALSQPAFAGYSGPNQPDDSSDLPF